MRDLAERVTRLKFVHDIIYWIEYVVLTTVLTFPLAYYEGYVREHKYGLATQTFGPWFGDQFKTLLLNVVLGAIAVPILFAIVGSHRYLLSVCDRGNDRAGFHFPDL